MTTMSNLSNEETQIDTTAEPIAIATRKKPGPKPKNPQARQIASGDTLSRISQSSGVEESRWYWIGVSAACPVGFITLSGECFAKMEELVSRNTSGDTVRTPVVGSLVKLTKSKLANMAKRIPCTVIRFLDGSDDATEAMDPNKTKRQRAQVITIPSPEQVEADRQAGRATRLYRQHPGDRPAAQFLYCIPVENQDDPYRGRTYQTLDQTGLEWPED